jgi:hypothetical protein
MCCGRLFLERFIHNENIRLYRKLLEQEQDEERLTVIRKLLAEEKAKDVRASPKGRGDNANIASYQRPPQLAASFRSDQTCDVARWHSFN